MGKKSKSKARSKASAFKTPDGSAGGTCRPTQKLQKCTRCLANIKDLSRGQQCPGCSHFYCWRCEKKYFRYCPNGGDCVHPLRRCLSCANTTTMVNALDAAGTALPEPASDGRVCGIAALASWLAFRKVVDQSETLSIDAVPFLGCGKKGCNSMECVRCVSVPEMKCLLWCSGCPTIRCIHCNVASLKSSPFGSLIYEACGDPEKRIQFDPSETAKRAEEMLHSSPDSFWQCGACKCLYCFRCIGVRGLSAIIGHNLMKGENPASFKCNKCYWSAKPCNNPKCPNEVGIPTKRCGDCRSARYCSKECQKVAYPEHIDTCEKVQKKRAARMRNKKIGN